MPRYLIERSFAELSEEDLERVGPRSKEILEESFPEIVWERSHVCVDADGRITSFCIYQAPDEDQLQRHAEILGDHVITRLYEIAGDVNPADLRA